MLKLRITSDDFQSLDKALQPLYVEQSDGYALNVEQDDTAAAGLKAKNAELLTKLAGEKERRITAEAQLKVVNETVAGYDQKINQIAGERDSYRAGLEKSLIDEPLTAFMRSNFIDGSDDFVVPVLKKFFQLHRNDDGTYESAIFINSDDGNGQKEVRADVEQLRKHLHADGKLDWVLKASGTSGGGSTSSVSINSSTTHRYEPGPNGQQDLTSQAREIIGQK
ncbi:hypothetical protein [Enterobacter hormaechei]|uniref:hypothetical protein n=1 Tax=Enterobacter hormaechei TaxID=158836 RepID=UPI002876BEC8|nr:hypothetical protein [Enterobacter hormaechei]MDR9969044.1 hypothetical protein [Enterobacter hormaechei subsp. xiangfangensis]